MASIAQSESETELERPVRPLQERAPQDDAACASIGGSSGIVDSTGVLELVRQEASRRRR